VRAYYRPGATSFERLESHIAHLLCSRPETATHLADRLVLAAGVGPGREKAIREALPAGYFSHPGEALGIARASLFFCGVTQEEEGVLTGRPRGDFAAVLKGYFRPLDLASPASYTDPGLVEGYCFMGASFARGMDRLFHAVTGQPLGEHLRRALTFL
jgi:hypothetical protein